MLHAKHAGLNCASIQATCMKLFRIHIAMQGNRLQSHVINTSLQF